MISMELQKRKLQSEYIVPKNLISSKREKEKDLILIMIQLKSLEK